MLSKYMTGKVYVDRDFPGCASIKEFAHQHRRHKRLGLIPGSGRSLEEGVANCCNILAGIIPRTKEPGRLQSLASQIVGHNWATEHTAHTDRYQLELQLCCFLVV